MQGDVQDPDLHICTYDASATTAARGIKSGPPFDPSWHFDKEREMAFIRSNPELLEMWKSVEETSLRMRQSMTAKP
jgi:hypothetical protein